MPNKWWSHELCGHDPGGRSGSRYCPKCGQAGTFVGWGYSMIEQMGAYQGFYGLKPRGPHSPLSHKLLAHLVEICTLCEGRGIIGSEGENWRPCERCHGFGRLLNCEKGVFFAARQEVLKEFPDAETPLLENYGNRQ